MTERKVICTSDAPVSKFPLSQAIVVNKTVYISGQVGLDPATSKLVEGGVEAECRQVLNNMGAILKAAGCGFKNVVKTTVLLGNMDDFAVVNKIYAEYFSEPYPARAAYAVAKLPVNSKVEIEAVAVVD